MPEVYRIIDGVFHFPHKDKILHVHPFSMVDEFVAIDAKQAASNDKTFSYLDGICEIMVRLGADSPTREEADWFCNAVVAASNELKKKHAMRAASLTFSE